MIGSVYGLDLRVGSLASGKRSFSADGAFSMQNKRGRRTPSEPRDSSEFESLSVSDSDTAGLRVDDQDTAATPPERKRYVEAESTGSSKKQKTETELEELIGDFGALQMVPPEIKKLSEDDLARTTLNNNQYQIFVKDDYLKSWTLRVTAHVTIGQLKWLIRQKMNFLPKVMWGLAAK